MWKPNKYWGFVVLLFCVSAALVFFIYLSSLTFEYFVFDDGFHISANPRFTPVTWQGILWYWTHSLMPVPYTVWGLVAKVFGVENPMPFRVLNLLLHAMNSVGVALWLRQSIKLFDIFNNKSESERWIAALLGGAVFLCHPVQVEAVAWVSGSKDLLAFFFGILSLNIYLTSDDSMIVFKKHPTFKFWVVMVLVLFSVLCKFSCAGLILLYFWMDYGFFRKKFNLKEIFKKYSMPVLLLIFGAFVLLKYVTPLSYLGFIPDYFWRIVISLNSITFYLRGLLFPMDYYFDYSLTPIRMIQSFLTNPWRQSVTVLPGILLWGLFLITYLKSQQKRWHYLLGIFLILSLPTTGIVPFVHQNISTTADRYLYFPMISFSLLVVYLFFAIPVRWASTALIVGVAIAFAHLSQIHVEKWRNTEACLKYTLKRNPNSYLANTAIASYYKKQGRQIESEIYLNRARIIESMEKEYR